MSEITPRNRAERRAAARAKGRRAAGTALTATKVGALVAASATAAFISAPSAGAASTITVSNLNDTGSGSLRDAISSASAGDTIVFQSGLSGTIDLGSKLTISESLTIAGPGGGAISISGQDTTNIFYLDGAATPTVTISGLTLTHGHAVHGGAVHEKTANHVTLDNDVITSNTSTSWGGAISGDLAGNTMTISNSTLSGNTAGRGGGVLYLDESDSVSISNSTFSGNTSGTAISRGGGALYLNTMQGPVSITGSTFTGNTGSDAEGGAMYFDTLKSSLTISSTTVTGNSSGSGGGIYIDEADGAVSIDSSTISGNTATDGSGGGLYFDTIDGTTSITNSTIANNTASSQGGGIYFDYHGDTVNIQNTTISGNTASEGGGGIWQYEGHGTFTVLDSTISGNTSTNEWGGGMYVTFNYDPIQIVQSTMANNHAGKDGGAMWFGSPYGLQLTQATISGNTATNICGIAFYGPQETPAAAHAHGHAGASAAKDKSKGDGKVASANAHTRKAHSSATGGEAGDVTATGSIVSANGSDPCQDFGSNGTGGHVTSDHSLIGVVDSSITFTDSGGTIRSSVPSLGALQNNGGPTETMALLPGSAAIDTGPNPVPSFPTNEFDQRGDGFARVVNGVVDIGAFEVQPPPTPQAVVITPKFTG